MTDTPPLPAFNDDGYRTTEPAISFTIERIVVARRNEIYRAWTDPELFKLWIVPPGQELVSLSVDTAGNAAWRTQGQADDDASVEYVLDPQTPQPYKAMETQFFTSAVPGMMYEHPVYLYLDLDKQQWEGKTTSTDYKLRVSYHSATLWRYASRVDLHTFWLDATERLTRLVEQNSILRETAA
ncbi:hypothetical protein [Methylobacterium sp. WL8]|uniref:hypothetical protein n=1 Tax=Methylobacterium sp. WL8 TaxID=2603899 RepID=UPI0011CBE4E2|nr:hypothetical protein [Methylobacterium sp. WL8]TXN82699.1 hypothetical protein FV234_09150 [Methylobacterium sp. WL8]